MGTTKKVLTYIVLVLGFATAAATANAGMFHTSASPSGAFDSINFGAA